MKKILIATSLAVVLLAGAVDIQAQTEPKASPEVAALKKEYAQMRKAHGALVKELKAKKKESPDADHSALETLVKKSQAKVKNKQKELKAKRVAQAPAKKKKSSKSKSNKMKDPVVEYPGDLKLKNGTILRKVSVLKVSKSKIVVSDAQQSNREVAVKDLTSDSVKKLKL